MRAIKFRAFNSLTNKMIDLKKTTPLALDANLNCDGIFIPFMDEYKIMQFTGLTDKNGKEIYEGDILRWYNLDIEYQTHYGDNIPLGSYTEPCGVVCKKFEMPVVFRDAMFTCNPPRDPEEDEAVSIDCPIQYPRPYDRKELNHIFYPRPYGRENEVLSDEEFLEAAQSCAEELGFECTSIADFISKINGFEIIGDIFSNPSLLNNHK